jgi:demethylmenaquinone methyltransferase/2-methoxy-6-polyprenyl-1,4-benzoquinol methylase
MPLFDHFSFIAPFYDRAIRLGEMNDFIRRAALPINGWLLDAGGGTGRVSNVLRDQAAHLVVADVSLGMLAQARQKGGLHTIAGETERLPFFSSSFDRIIMVDALHHVANHAQTAREMWRVLKPGGRIVIEELDVRTLIIKLVALGEKIALMRSHFITPPQIVALFSNTSAQSQIETEGYNAWIIIEKPATT